MAMVRELLQLFGSKIWWHDGIVPVL